MRGHSSSPRDDRPHPSSRAFRSASAPPARFDGDSATVWLLTNDQPPFEDYQAPDELVLALTRRHVSASTH